MFNASNNDIRDEVLELSSEKNKRQLSNKDKKMVAFLTDQKLPRPIDFARLLPEDFIEAETIAAERNRMCDEFASLSPKALLIEYNGRRSQLKSESRIVFKKLSAREVTEWVRKDAWTLDEAISLLLGYVPHNGARNWAEKNHPYFEPARKFVELAGLMGTAIAIKKLYDLDEPSHFVIWSKDKGIPLPSEIEIKVLRDDRSAASWKNRYERMQLENENLRAENGSLNSEIKKLGSPSYKTALQIIAVLAIKEGFKSEAIRNAATKDIASKLMLAGVELSDKTVLKYIRDGIECLPKKYGSDLLWHEKEPSAKLVTFSS
jgi:hypothetical protein